MPYFSLKPFTVDAVQWTGANRPQIEALVPPEQLVWSTGEPSNPGLKMPGGVVQWVAVTDWVALPAQGGLCSAYGDAAFGAAYQPATGP
jgi:hypothetical protein